MVAAYGAGMADDPGAVLSSGGVIGEPVVPDPEGAAEYRKLACSYIELKKKIAGGIYSYGA